MRVQPISGMMNRVGGQQRVNNSSTGWKRTLVLTGMLVLTAYLGTSALTLGPTDSQIIRFSLWVGFSLTGIGSLILFLITSKEFGIELSKTLSTYLCLAAVLLLGSLYVMRRLSTNDVDPFLVEMSDFEIGILAFITVLVLIALILNVVSTNAAFGIILTIFQAALSVALISIVLVMAFLLGQSSGTAPHKRRLTAKRRRAR